MNGSTEPQTNTTAGAAAAGAALGGIVGWVISLATGADTSPISAGLATVGAFCFGLIFPGK